MPRKARIDIPGPLVPLEHDVVRGMEMDVSHKSRACEEEACLLELTRYIHLNLTGYNRRKIQQLNNVPFGPITLGVGADLCLLVHLNTRYTPE